MTYKDRILALAEAASSVNDSNVHKLEGDIVEVLDLVPNWVSYRDSPDRSSWSGGRDYWTAPTYMRSVDDAMTLIPTGCAPRMDWMHYSKDREGVVSYEVFIENIANGEVRGWAEADTHAEAITVASLIAIAEGLEND